MKRQIIAVASVITACATVQLVAEGPAVAATSDCANGYACLWEDRNFQTNGDDAGWYRVSTYVAHLGSHTYHNWPNDFVGDSSSSGFNHTTRTVQLFIDARCRGANVIEPSAWSDTDFGNGSPGGGGFDDAISSVALSGYYTTCFNSA